jgi:mRNA interferase RelE/StbE
VVTPPRRVEISRRAQAFILSLPENLRQKIKAAMERIILGDFTGLDVKKLTGHPQDYRLRVGRVRILFTLDGDRLLVYRAAFRGEAYKA